MNTKKLVAFNTVAQIVGKVATVSSTLVITLLITRSLGQVSYGEFTIIMAYAALFYLAVDFGVNAIFTQKVTTDETKLKTYFFNLISLRVVLSLVFVFLAISFLSFSPYSPAIKVGIIIASLTILTQGLFNTANALFQYKLRYNFSTTADVVASLINVLIVYGLVRASADINLIVASYVITGVFRVIIAFWLARRILGSLSLDVNLEVWKIFLLASLPLGLTAIFSQVNGNADKVILSVVKFDPGVGYDNIVGVGWYGLAYKIFEVILVIPTFVMNSAYPVLVRSFQEGGAKLKEIFLFLLGSLLGLSIAIASFGYLLAPYLIQLFQKGEGSFIGSVDILRILLLGLPVFYVSALTLWVTISIGKQKYLVWIYGLAALTNIILNFMFAPRFGVTAAAVITIFTELMVIIPTGVITYKALFGETRRV